MKLKPIYTDVYAKLNLAGLEHGVYRQDIIKSINDAIRELRQEYIVAEVPNEFIHRSQVALTVDDEFKRLNSGTLDKEPLEDVPINFTIINSELFKTDKQIVDAQDTFNKGDIAYKNGVLYEAIEDATNVNSFDLTFKDRRVRMYKGGNGLLYKEGDVIFDVESKSHYRVNANFEAVVADDAINIPELDLLYWKKKEDEWLRGSYIEFHNIDKSAITDEFYPFISIHGSKIYSNKFITNVNISYIPKWEDVEDYDDKVNIPESMLPKVKELATAKLLYYYKGVEDVKGE